MENLKVPALLVVAGLVSIVLGNTAMKIWFHSSGADEGYAQSLAAAKALDDPVAAAELLDKEWQRSHPGEKRAEPKRPRPDSGEFSDDSAVENSGGDY